MYTDNLLVYKQLIDNEQCLTCEGADRGIFALTNVPNLVTPTAKHSYQTVRTAYMHSICMWCPSYLH